MATKDLLFIGALAVAAFVLTKKTTFMNETGEDSGGSSGNITPTQQPAVIATPNLKVTAPVSGSVRTASVRTATASELKQIDITAQADKTKVIYYPDTGIVTAGGLGYSTNNPASYLRLAYTMQTTNGVTSATPDNRSGF